MQAAQVQEPTKVNYRLLLLNALPENKAEFAREVLVTAPESVKELLLNLHAHSENLILYVDLWLNEIDSVDEIVTLGNLLASKLKNTKFENLSSILHKQCTLQIILLLFKQVLPCAFNPNDNALLLVDTGASLATKIKEYCRNIIVRFAIDAFTAAHKDFPGGNFGADVLKSALSVNGSRKHLVSSHVKEFMQEHRNSFFQGGFGRTSSIKMLELLEEGQYKSASQLLIKEIDEFTQLLKDQFNLSLDRRPTNT